MRKRKPLYFDAASNGFEQLNIEEDSIQASGYIFGSSESFITLDNFENIILKDNNSGERKLEELTYRTRTERIVLSENAISLGKVTLEKTPVDSESVRLVPLGGIDQENGSDFIVQDNELIFKNLGLDGFLEVDEIIYVYYTS
jgi:hypothetical protein